VATEHGKRSTCCLRRCITLATGDDPDGGRGGTPSVRTASWACGSTSGAEWGQAHREFVAVGTAVMVDAPPRRARGATKPGPAFTSDLSGLFYGYVLDAAAGRLYAPSHWSWAPASTTSRHQGMMKAMGTAGQNVELPSTRRRCMTARTRYGPDAGRRRTPARRRGRRVPASTRPATPGASHATEFFAIGTAASLARRSRRAAPAWLCVERLSLRAGRAARRKIARRAENLPARLPSRPHVQEDRDRGAIFLRSARLAPFRRPAARP